MVAGHHQHLYSTQSEVVVPVVVQAAADTEGGGDLLPQQQQAPRLLAVLDVDSDHPAAFDAVDAKHLEQLCSWLADKYAEAACR
jgi:putative methionine-R-sulfoxide reductase with GAF domain